VYKCHADMLALLPSHSLQLPSCNVTGFGAAEQQYEFYPALLIYCLAMLAHSCLCCSWRCALLRLTPACLSEGGTSASTASRCWWCGLACTTG
jgi:hypothetical protein